jgi:Ca2+-binding EF-hand superfamily protein
MKPQTTEKFHMNSERKPQSPLRRPLTGDELADLDEQFDECDADGDQRIDFTEFVELLEKLGSELPMTQRRDRFAAIDTDSDGAINRSEFMDWWRSA